MADKKRRNVFEDHIESELFDVSRLGDPNSDVTDALQRQVQSFLSDLQQPLDYRVWDNELDDRQKRLCAYLATELVEQVLRPQFENELADLNDEELVYMLTTPLAVAILAEDRFKEEKPVVEPTRISEPIRFTEKRRARFMRREPAYGHLPAQQEQSDLPEWAQILGQAVRDVRAFLGRLFRRQRS